MRRSFVLLLFVCLAAVHPMAAGKRERWTRVSVMEPKATLALTNALDGAVDWLADEGCRQIFTEFHDLSGRPLTERLAELKVDGPAFLRLIVWYDGTFSSQCRSGGPLAYTAPGSRVVFICTQLFADATFSNLDLGRAVVLHEALHSLGLGENPPSSREITRRVRTMCGERRRS